MAGWIGDAATAADEAGGCVTLLAVCRWIIGDLHHCAFQQWKSREYLLRFDKVKLIIKRFHFLRTRCRTTSWECHSRRFLWYTWLTGSSAVAELMSLYSWSRNCCSVVLSSISKNLHTDKSKKFRNHHLLLAQPAAWINVNCRTHWASISWTHIAASGNPEATPVSGSV